MEHPGKNWTMENDKPYDSSSDFEEALEEEKHKHFVLRLFIAGNSVRSALAIENIREVCETNLKGRYSLEVIDIYQQPELARSEQVLAAPTLIKSLPLPLRRIIGDLSSSERVLVGLSILPLEDRNNTEE